MALRQRALEKCGVNLGKRTPLFRATTDGFRAKTFHDNCDGKGNTLTVVLTEFGHVIGGFTTVPWASKKAFKRDNGAWLFVARVNDSKKELLAGTSLPVILKAKATVGAHVIHDPALGPSFGLDLCLVNKCGTHTGSGCRLHWFDEVCDGVTINPKTITGDTTKLGPLDDSSFRVVDYEVFACDI